MAAQESAEPRRERRERKDRREATFADGDIRPVRRSTAHEVDRRRAMRRDQDTPIFAPGLAPMGGHDLAPTPASPLTLREVREIAEGVAREIDPALEVMAAVNTEGGQGYVEVWIMMRGCHDEPCRMTIGVNRRTTASTLRPLIAHRIQEYLERRQQTQ